MGSPPQKKTNHITKIWLTSIVTGGIQNKTIMSYSSVPSKLDTIENQKTSAGRNRKFS